MNVINGTTKEYKKQTDPALDLAPAVSDDEELTPEEVQMVCGDVKCAFMNICG